MGCKKRRGASRGDIEVLLAHVISNLIHAIEKFLCGQLFVLQMYTISLNPHGRSFAFD